MAIEKKDFMRNLGPIPMKIKLDAVTGGYSSTTGAGSSQTGPGHDDAEMCDCQEVCGDVDKRIAAACNMTESNINMKMPATIQSHCSCALWHKYFAWITISTVSVLALCGIIAACCKK